MTVRAKFYVQEIKHLHTGRSEDVCAIIKLAAAFGTYAKGDDEGNKDWSKYTPQGSLEMTVTNPAAIAGFELGQCYYLDFTPVE